MDRAHGVEVADEPVPVPASAPAVAPKAKFKKWVDSYQVGSKKYGVLATCDTTGD
jgi:hypothetical protein